MLRRKRDLYDDTDAMGKKGTITPAMEAVAAYEGLDPEVIRERVAQGVIAIPCNINHKICGPAAWAWA